MNRFLLFLLIITLFAVRTEAFELDSSIDDEIMKNYNSSALEESLPSLPKVSPSQTYSGNSGSKSATPPKSLPVIENGKTSGAVKSLPYKANVDKSTAIRIKKGTKFKVKSSAYISDSTRIGANFSFTTLNPVYQKFVTIPAGTTFHAVIVDSHSPQITGNGGLIKVVIDSINYKGYTYEAEGKVTKANYKKIFINNIKGQRKYWKGVANQIGKGQRFYTKTRNISAKLSNNPFGTIISPIPTIVGAGAYTINFVGSPIIAIASKGGKISIPAGSEFEIKLLDDVFLEN